VVVAIAADNVEVARGVDGTGAVLTVARPVVVVASAAVVASEPDNEVVAGGADVNGAFVAVA
jgi:xanthine dehydrogenase iron-sulfur cluster and FAD-binding subunit A